MPLRESREKNMRQITTAVGVKAGIADNKY